MPPVKDIHEPLYEIGPRSHPTLTGRVTWHDPCHLGRDLGVTREPREIIAGLPGVEYVESGELACSGGGPVFSMMHYELALKIDQARVMHTSS